MVGSDDANNQLKGKHVMRQYDLECRYDNRASFYGKAKVIEDSFGNLILQSYETRVASIGDRSKLGGKRWPVVFGTYSVTTLRHIKEFLLQNDFKAENSKQIMADYGTIL